MIRASPPSSKIISATSCSLFYRPAVTQQFLLNDYSKCKENNIFILAFEICPTAHDGILVQYNVMISNG
jgi:hypothetical protein